MSVYFWLKKHHVEMSLIGVIISAVVIGYFLWHYTEDLTSSIALSSAIVAFSSVVISLSEHKNRAGELIPKIDILITKGSPYSKISVQNYGHSTATNVTIAVSKIVWPENEQGIKPLEDAINRTNIIKKTNIFHYPGKYM